MFRNEISTNAGAFQIEVLQAKVDTKKDIGISMSIVRIATTYSAQRRNKTSELINVYKLYKK